MPRELDYLSIDIDSTDIWVWRALLKSGKYRPRVVSIEYNSNLPLGDFRVFPDDVKLRRQGNFMGASLSALNLVALEFG